MEPLSSCPEVAVEQALAAAPTGFSKAGGREPDIWLFTYGAMLEYPPFDAVDRETVSCPGWRRDFCLCDTKLRGTPEGPGVVLGLVEGDQCVGIAWRLAAQTARLDLCRVLTAEVRLPFYRPAWLPIHSPNGHTTALALIADTQGPLFEPCLAEHEVVERLATSSGEAGSNADYLREVVAGLDGAGVADFYLSRLWSSVRKWPQRAKADDPATGR